MDLLILAALVCGEPKLVPESGWTKRDLEEVEEAKKGCQKFFGSKSCLVWFRKVGELNYEAICMDKD